MGLRTLLTTGTRSEVRRRHARGVAAAGFVLSLATPLAAQPVRPPLPPSSLAVPDGDDWRVWWRSEDAPAHWPAPLPAVAGAVAWRPAAPGLEWGELRLAGTGEAWRLRVVLVRLDPERAALRVHANVDAEGLAQPWTVDAAPPEAVLALNAGHFTDAGPWGWVVHGGVERRPPGAGPLAPAVVVDTSGRVRVVPPDGIEALRRSHVVAEAIQSYPVLLHEEEVPHQLAGAGRGIDVAHRDSRLALGVLRDGRVLVALTRFEGLGGALEELPFGPTVPEMAALMGALGCRSAVLLDGGISGQLRLRDARGEERSWRGWRKVALGLVAVPRRAAR